jgi:cell division protein FtsI (penicillin-binding protein 3)
MNQRPVHDRPFKTSLQRARLFYGILLLVFAVFIVRLFYLQIIRHDYYQKAALQGQLKEYEIMPARGVIEAHDGEQIIPIVLNETRYTLFADPKFISNPEDAAKAVAGVIGGNQAEYSDKMQADSRYSILAKKLSKEQKSKLDSLELKGLGTRDEPIRTYPQGTLAAQVLGFVNDEGQGKYGIEQFLDDRLRGTPGRLRAITDAAGVPLVANPDNVVTEPKNGQRTILTIDIPMQRQLEAILQKGLTNASSKSGSAIIIDPYSGAVKAMANFPTYNPAEFYKVEDAAVFNNAAASSPLEVGSIMKPLTAAAALDNGAVSPSTSYYDPGFFLIDGAVVRNIEEDGGAGTRDVRDILRLSLNTGAVWLLKQLGGGELNAQARQTWHEYMTDRYRFGRQTGIEQGYEAEGIVPDPNDGFGLNIRYANTSFGQGVSTTPVQMAAALAGAINGGTYYRPRLVDSYVNGDGQVTSVRPDVLREQVVRKDVSAQLRTLMESVVERNHVLYGMPNLPSEYSIGGKTGTAEVAKPEGGYYADIFNGTFYGFVGGDKPEYVIMVRVDRPGIGGYAGSRAAAPIFSELATMLINNFHVSPKSP